MVMVLIYLSVHNKISLKKRGIVIIIMIIGAVLIGILYLLTISMNDSCQEIIEPKKINDFHQKINSKEEAILIFQDYFSRDKRLQRIKMQEEEAYNYFMGSISQNVIEEERKELGEEEGQAREHGKEEWNGEEKFYWLYGLNEPYKYILNDNGELFKQWLGD